MKSYFITENLLPKEKGYKSIIYATYNSIFGTVQSSLLYTFIFTIYDIAIDPQATKIKLYHWDYLDKYPNAAVFYGVPIRNYQGSK